MIDPKFTEKIVKWLQSDHSSQDAIEAGANLLLQLNRDRGMYQRIMHRPQRMLSFLEFKLRRFLQMRKDGQTISDVINIDNEITPQITAAIEAEKADEAETTEQNDHFIDTNNMTYVRKGIRPDHDKLPPEIQAIWPANAERWKKIKEAFEACKSLTEPCDRYEYLKILKETWYKYKEEMAKYDEYMPGNDTGSDTTSSEDQTPALTPEQEKEMKNADSYVSKNLTQLLQLTEASKIEVFNDEQTKNLESLRQRVQQRVDVLLKYGRVLTDERREQLIECGLSVVLATADEQEESE